MWIIDRFMKQPPKRNLGALVDGSIELTKGAIDDSSLEILLKHRQPAKPAKATIYRQHLQSFLRSIKLALLSRFLIIKSDKERPKVALYRNRLTLFLHCPLHIPPFAGAITLIVLNLVNFFYTYGPYDSTGLQFVAKLHELLMQASIAAILLDMIRCQVFKSHLPFGFLFAPTNTTAISYLWSLDYWSAISASAVPWKLRLATGLFTFCTLALAALVGPSSAVTMIPRIVTRRSGFPTTGVALERTPLETFPSVFNAGLNFTISSEFEEQSLNGLSIAPDFDFIQNFTWDLLTQDDDGTSTMMNMMIESPESQFPKGIASLPRSEVSKRLSTQYVKEVILSTDNEILSHMDAITYSIEASRAVVSVRCNPQTWKYWSDTTPPVQLLKENPNETWDLGLLADLVPEDSAGGRKNSWHGAKLIPPPKDSMDSAVALIFRSNTPYEGRNSTVDDVEMSVCGIRARWEPAKYEIQGSSDMRTVRSTPSQLDKTWLVSQISMTEGWLQQLYPFIDTIGKKSILPLKDPRRWNPDSLKMPLETYLAGIVAKAVSSVYENTWDPPYWQCTLEVSTSRWKHISGKICDRGQTCPSDFDVTSTGCSNIKSDLYKSGYGYGITSTSVILSLIVLIFYCTLVLVYFLIILIRGTTSTALDSPAELVALGLQSKHPKHLGNISVGIETMATLRAEVGIRVNSEENLELVFKDDPQQNQRSLAKIEANKEY